MLQLVYSAKMFVFYSTICFKVAKKSSNFFNVEFLPLSPVVTPPAMLNAALKSPAQEGHGLFGASLEECHQCDQRDEAPLLSGKVKRIGIV